MLDIHDRRSASQSPSASTRRRFLQHAALLTFGTMGMLASRTPPVSAAAKRKLTMLDWNHFVPIYEEKLREWGNEFSKANNCEVKIDHIAHRDLYVRLAAEAETKSGHDIVMLWWTNPQLYAENLIDLDDIGERIGENGGGWYQIARDVNMQHGHWKAVPLYASTMPQTYREDLFQEVGEERPDSWEDVLRAGRKLKPKGYPSGFAFAQTEDSNITLYALLWSFGTSTVDESGKVTINNPRTKEAIEFAKAMYRDMMTEEVLSWDDASNNRAFLSGKWAWVHNAVSIYAAEPKNAPQLRAVTGHALTPKGSGGRHGVSIPFNYGIWKFSKNQELAKEFLAYISAEERLSAAFEATETFNNALLKNFEQHPYWDKDPKLTPIRAYNRDAHMIGWPGPLDRRAELARVTWVVPNMFTKAVTGASTDDAMKWGEAELKKIYAAT
jgi:multiple sugar transport system substrate-binding protein